MRHPSQGLYFSGPEEARRYAQSRPYFHPLAVGRAAAFAGVSRPVAWAVDVACGTGLSSVALATIARRVIGIDLSANMLANAQAHERVHYAQAQAETMPFPSGSVPLMSCALAFHWFDRQRFLGETARVLAAGGLMLIYNNGFTGAMRENAEFGDWSRRVYPARFPVPPRDSRPFTPDDAAGAGFDFLAEERYENEVSFTAAELVAYLQTQTNMAAAVAQGRESYPSARRWLLDQVRPFFAGERATCVFSTTAWYLRKAGA